MPGQRCPRRREQKGSLRDWSKVRSEERVRSEWRREGGNKACWGRSRTHCKDSGSDSEQRGNSRTFLFKGMPLPVKCKRGHKGRNRKEGDQLRVPGLDFHPKHLGHLHARSCCFSPYAGAGRRRWAESIRPNAQEQCLQNSLGLPTSYYYYYSLMQYNKKKNKQPFEGELTKGKSVWTEGAELGARALPSLAEQSQGRQGYRLR